MQNPRKKRRRQPLTPEQQEVLDAAPVEQRRKPKATHSAKRALVLKRRARRARVAKLYHRGVRDCQSLADKLGVHKTTIARDLRVLEQMWQRQMFVDFNASKVALLAELSEIRQQAWEAWEKSKEPGQKVVAETKGDGENNQVVVGTSRTVESHYGDPRFLKAILDCSEREAKLLGLEVTKISATSPDGSTPYHSQVFSDLMAAVEVARGGPLIVDDQYLADLLADAEDGLVVEGTATV